jgi:heme A synthase
LYTDLNFSHTRLGAVFVSLVVLIAVFKTLRKFSWGSLMGMRAMWCGALVVLQVTLGVLVVVHQNPNTIATLHVFLGAALLASLAALWVHTTWILSDSGKKVSDEE